MLLLNFYCFYSTLQKTLEELKDYQKQQELWINYHKKLRAEQAPPSVLLEQRLHYREFKIRQQLESTVDDSLNDNMNKSPKNPYKDPLAELDLDDFILIPTKLRVKFTDDLTAGRLTDKIIIALDTYEKMAAEYDDEQGKKEVTDNDISLAEYRKANSDTETNRDDSLSDHSSSANNESNEEESSKSSGGGVSASSAGTASNNNKVSRVNVLH